MSGYSKIFDGIIQPSNGSFSAEHANYILSLDFTPEEHGRYEVLAEKSNEGSLTPDERYELEMMVMADTMLAILQSKARVSLKKHPTAA